MNLGKSLHLFVGGSGWVYTGPQYAFQEDFILLLLLIIIIIIIIIISISISISIIIIIIIIIIINRYDLS